MTRLLSAAESQSNMPSSDSIIASVTWSNPDTTNVAWEKTFPFVCRLGTAMHFMPAARAAITPFSVSSSTTQSAGGMPELLAGPKKDIGMGFGPFDRIAR